MATIDFQPWRRQHDDPESPPIVPSPKGHYYAGSLQDLIDIVAQAEGPLLAPKPEVRACGSHWALSEAALTHDFIVETNPADPALPRLNKQVREVIPYAISKDAWEFFRGQGVTTFNPAAPPDHSKFNVFHVEAGMRIYELYCMLDSTDDNDPNSIAARLPQYRGPWAMETLGGAGGQTIVGAFSTGTHGGDVHLPPIADAVQAIHLVGTEGHQYWIERELAPGIWLVDDDVLQDVYPKIEIVRDPGVFNAVLVAAGRMGLIYSVVLRAVRQYALEENRTQDSWANVKLWVSNPTHPNFNNRFVQVLVNPNGKPDARSEHSAFVTFRTLKPLDAAGKPPFAGMPPFGRKERCGDNAGNSMPIDAKPGSFFNSICESDSPLQAAITKMIDDLQDFRDQQLIAAGVASFFGQVEIAATCVTAAAVAEAGIIVLHDLRSVVPSGPLGKTIGGIANWAAENDHMEIFRRLAEIVIEDQQEPHNYTAISYAVMDIHNYKDKGCSVSGDSLEVLFDVSTPAAGANMVAFVERLFDRRSELENGSLTGQPMAFPGYVSLRFMSQSRALLAMQKFPRVCALEITGFLAAHGTVPFLKQVERDAWEMGAAIHWGQRNDLIMKQVEKTFDWLPPAGPLYVWRDALAKLSRHGRFDTFSTSFTRVRGLEVVEPQVQGFTALPTETCAGLPVHMMWMAEDNPPGTQVRLEIAKPTSSAPFQVIPLPALNGSQDVIAPAGRNDFNLVAARTLNGRTLTHSRTISVRAFQDHEVWQFKLFATCVPVDGASRWAVTISFGSTVAPQVAVEELRCFFSGAAAWKARRSGLVDITFTPASPVQPLPTQPRLAEKEWLFFVTAPGCVGTVPQLDVQFRIVRV